MISIIVGMYNCEHTINKTIKSILNQSFNDFELLLIDDGSIDNTLEIIKTFDDSRIKIFEQNNKGISNVRNKGIGLAQGEYICFVDSDDYIEIDYLKELYEYMTNNNLDYVMCNYNKVINDNKYMMQPTFNENTIIADKQLLINKIFYGNNKYNLSSNCMGLYKRNIIIENNLKLDEDLYYGEDILFNYQYIQYINRFGYLNKALYNYTYNNESLSNNLTINKIELLINKIKNNINKYNDIENKYIKSYYLNQFIIYLSNIFKLNKQDRIREYYNIRNNKILDDISYKDLLNIKDKIWLYLIKKNKYEIAYKLWKLRNNF